jgi:RNA polymerase sigma-70 factor (ECF subfamily)
MAFLVMLERLSPVERAVFLLRDVFDCDYGEIAQVVGKSEMNCRQIFVRCRRHLGTSRARYTTSIQQSQALVGSFLVAAQTGDLQQLVKLLATDVVFYGDGGGKATSLGTPLHGRERVANFLISVFKRGRSCGITQQPVMVNGGPGIVNRDHNGDIVSVVSMDVLGGEIRAVRSVVNPDKLGHIGTVSDFLAPDRTTNPKTPSRR